MKPIDPWEVFEYSIEEHPFFRKPQNDWRVIKGYYDEDTGEMTPEDRSKWRPEEDGKCLADFWDFEKKVMRDAPPIPGVSTFLLTHKNYWKLHFENQI